MYDASTPSNDSELPDAVVQVRAVNNAIKNQATIKQHTWRLSNPIQEATQLVTTSDGRLLSQANATENYINTQAVCY